MTDFQIEVVELLKQGLRPGEVSKKLNRNGSSVSSVIKALNITGYNKQENTCNHNYFDNIDTEIKAYLLGFFIADGWLNVGNSRFGLQIKEEDNIVLHYIKNEFVNDSVISTKNRTTETVTRKNISTIRWTSSHMKDIFMNKYKILENKTYDETFMFPFEEIPEHLIRHFIRGFFDGDGCFSKIKQSLSITIISTSLNFLNQIAKYFTNLSEGINEVIREINGKTTNYYTLNFNFERTDKPEKVLKIYNYLYDDSELYLIRKKDKIESYLKYRGKL